MSVQCDVTAKQHASVPMSMFERYLTVWVLLCIVAGIALGQFFPGVFQAIATHTPDMWITVELYPYRAQPDEAARAARVYLLAQAAAASVTIA